MKYQIVVHENKELVPGPADWQWGTRIGHDGDRDRESWPEYNAWRRIAIDRGGMPRYWGPLDSVVPLEVNGVPDERYAKTTFTFNDLQTCQEFFDMTTTPDNNAKHPKIYLLKIVEVQDDGTFVRVVTQTNTKPLQLLNGEFSTAH